MELDRCKQELSEEKLSHQETEKKITSIQKQIAVSENWKEIAKNLEIQRDELSAKLMDTRANYAQ